MQKLPAIAFLLCVPASSALAPSSIFRVAATLLSSYPLVNTYSLTRGRMTTSSSEWPPAGFTTYFVRSGQAEVSASQFKTKRPGHGCAAVEVRRRQRDPKSQDHYD
jgi:hypothetical protein